MTATFLTFWALAAGAAVLGVAVRGALAWGLETMAAEEARRDLRPAVGPDPEELEELEALYPEAAE